MNINFILKKQSCTHCSGCFSIASSSTRTLHCWSSQAYNSMKLPICATKASSSPHAQTLSGTLTLLHFCKENESHWKQNCKYKNVLLACAPFFSKLQKFWAIHNIYVLKNHILLSSRTVLGLLYIFGRVRQNQASDLPQIFWYAKPVLSLRITDVYVI